MASKTDDLIDEEPPTIDPYTVLNVEKTATDEEVKSAYRKAALKHHPDKAPEHLKSTAHTTFQEIAFAYAVLSDPTRRRRYDATGSTSESIVDSDGFSWSDFYGEQFRDVISSEAIARFAEEYKGSDEEKEDLLLSYKENRGNMDQVYATVMLSDPLEDDKRFREIIDGAIEDGNVRSYKPYVNETEKSKAARIKNASDEGAEAMAYAEKLGVAGKLFGKKGSGSGEDSLAALIQQRQQGRSSFLDSLEAKYAPKPNAKAKGKKNKKRSSEDSEKEGEPSEEAFQAAAMKLNAKAREGELGSGRKSKRMKN